MGHCIRGDHLLIDWYGSAVKSTFVSYSLSILQALSSSLVKDIHHLMAFVNPSYKNADHFCLLCYFYRKKYLYG